MPHAGILTAQAVPEIAQVALEHTPSASQTKCHQLKLNSAPTAAGQAALHPYLIKQLHQRWQQPAGDELLDLLARPSSDVAERPRSFLLYGWLRVSQEKGQDSQDARINSCLGLLIGPCHNIPNGTESWGLGKLEQMKEVRRILISRDTCQEDKFPKCLILQAKETPWLITLTDLLASSFALSSFRVLEPVSYSKLEQSIGLTSNQAKLGSGGTASHTQQDDIPSLDVGHQRRGTQGWEFASYHNDQLRAAHELHQPWENPCVHDDLDAIVGAIGQVGNCPAGVSDDFLVLVLQEAGEDRQHLPHRIQGWVGVLVPAEVRQSPRDVPQEPNLEQEQGVRSSLADRASQEQQAQESEHPASGPCSSEMLSE